MATRGTREQSRSRRERLVRATQADLYPVSGRGFVEFADVDVARRAGGDALLSTPRAALAEQRNFALLDPEAQANLPRAQGRRAWIDLTAPAVLARPADAGLGRDVAPVRGDLVQAERLAMRDRLAQEAATGERPRRRR